MKLWKAISESQNCCENCRFFIQHYIKVPFIDKDYIETDDGYCTRKRRKNVRTHWSCNEFEAKANK